MATYDVVLIGGGIAGLWLANVLQQKGYTVALLEENTLGGEQTLASQGMIHGGQKYTLQGNVSKHAASIAAMPQRWQESFSGQVVPSLTTVNFLSDYQLLWPAGSLLSSAAVLGAAQLINANKKKLARKDFPAALAENPHFRGPVYYLPEKVLDIRSLIQALSLPLKGSLWQGTVTHLDDTGGIIVNNTLTLNAQLIIFAAGAGNETAFRLTHTAGQHTQRRPLCQIMVRSLPWSLHGHGIINHPKPRFTVTSHPLPEGGYVWYLGGGLAEQSVHLDDAAALAFARSELAAVFPHISWQNKEWALWRGDRAEPFDPAGRLPHSSHIKQLAHPTARLLVAWPTKLTFAPALADSVLQWMTEHSVVPLASNPDPIPLPTAKIGLYPWETAKWH
jgi:2-polyprenyl-6-methoxyphenol hydroxylase-like FAD-dependent oxidoreductase